MQKQEKIRLSIVSSVVVLLTTLAFFALGAAGTLDVENPIIGPTKALSQETASILSAEEEGLLDEVNRERSARGLRTLLIDPKMVAIARRHSQEMVSSNYFAHDSPANGSLLDRVTSTGANGWIVAGENLAGAASVDSAHQAVLGSPPHKENMLDPRYTHVGIGVAHGGPYGKMFTEDFIAYKAGLGPADLVDGLVVSPNPSHPRQEALAGRYATFYYSLKRPATVDIKIYSWRGEVKTLKPRTLQGAGAHHTTWTGTNNKGNILPQGNYRYILTASSSGGSEQRTGIVSIR